MRLIYLCLFLLFSPILNSGVLQGLFFVLLLFMYIDSWVISFCYGFICHLYPESSHVYITSLDLSLQVHVHIPRCLLDTSVWCLKPTMYKTDLLVSLPLPVTVNCANIYLLAQTKNLGVLPDFCGVLSHSHPMHQ